MAYKSTIERLPLKLERKVIVYPMTATFYEEAVGLLVRQALHGLKDLYNKHQEIAKAIFRRDESGGTVLPGGLALPHIWVEGLSEERTALGLFSKGSEIVNPKGQGVFAIFLSLQPPDETRRLGVLEEAYKILGSTKLLYRLKQANSPEAIAQLLQNQS